MYSHQQPNYEPSGPHNVRYKKGKWPLGPSAIRGPSPPPHPPVRGQWVRAGVSFAHTEVCDDDPQLYRGSITLPPYRSMEAIRDAQPARVAEYRDTRWCAPLTQRCLLMELPPELLVRIAYYVVPTEMSFHVLPSSHTLHVPNADQKGMLVHAFGKPEHVDIDTTHPQRPTALIRPNLTALARTCKALQHIYYETFYGRNFFVFNVTTKPYGPRLDGKASGANAPYSWCRLYEEARPEGLWPLTPRTAEYVTDVIFLVTATGGRLRSEVRHINEAIETIQYAKSLKHVTVDIDTRPATAYDRLVWSKDGDEDYVLKLRQTTVHDDDVETVANLYECFTKARGVQQVTISGSISGKSADMIAEKMKRPYFES